MDLYNTYLLLSTLSSASSLTGTGTTNNSLPNSGVQTSIFQNLFQNIQNRDTTSAKTLSAGTSMDRIFEEAAQKYGVNVNLLKAIGKAESGFDAKSTSSAGAMGVMQLMPGTAKYLGVTNPYDARQNIMGGAKYISQLLKQFNGNETLALAAYNAGPGNVSKYGGVPPFTETQNYVKRVLSYAGENISTGKTVTGSAQQSQTALNTGAANQTSVDTETLLSLITLMRAQMDLKMNNMITSSYTNNSDNNSFINL